MLKENGPPPKGKWADIAILEPVRDFKARHASTLLTFDATVDCVNQIEAAARARDEATHGQAYTIKRTVTDQNQFMLKV